MLTNIDLLIIKDKIKNSIAVNNLRKALREGTSSTTSSLKNIDRSEGENMDKNLTVLIENALRKKSKLYPKFGSVDINYKDDKPFDLIVSERIRL